MRLCLFFLLIITTIFSVSCGPQEKVLNYLQNYADSSGKDSVKLPELVIQKNDLLSIIIYSASTIPETDALYNLPEQSIDAGYLVDVNGNINIPRLGSIKAEGLTKLQLEQVIKQKLMATGELESPNVIIRFLNYRITVLGEVARAGTYNIPTERITIFEAIGLAGDLTIYAKKDDVMIIREKDGKRQYGKLDLSSKEIFSSPYFFLSQNDVLFVNATKNKNRLNEQVTAQRISIGLSIITSLALLYNIFR